jgi:hypothetical protein
MVIAMTLTEIFGNNFFFVVSNRNPGPGRYHKSFYFRKLCFDFINFHNRKSMFAVLHSDINSLKSGLLYLTAQSYRKKKSRSAKVKDRMINLILRNYLVDRYRYTDI